MSTRLILTGDINLMNVEDPAIPFNRVIPTLRSADVRFGNLECSLYHPPGGRHVEHEGFFADPKIGSEALKQAGFDAVGLANNVNYGEPAITASIAALDAIGLPHTGAGANRDAARAPAIVTRHGQRIGFLQRSSVYWPTNHEAGAHAAGIAVLQAHTAYQIPLHKTRREIPPMNRPGLPPIILTWPDPKYLQTFRDEIEALRASTDIVVASCHWGLGKEVLTYMTEIAHAAIDAGAHVVIGHGPHHFLPVEMYRGRPIFYGLGSFSFHTGHGGHRHGDWIGMMADVTIDAGKTARAGFRFVRHNDQNETVFSTLSDETAAVHEARSVCDGLGVTLVAEDDALWVDLS
jgi:poly-gamma-glutamate capsule biosynthesis protein CapA/YwtB (metallophosphatase superfamily)